MATSEPCRTCGEPVSTLALACPRCGTRAPTPTAFEQSRSGSRVLVIGGAAGGLAVLAIIAVALSSGHSLGRSDSLRGALPEVQLAALDSRSASPPDSTIARFSGMLGVLNALCTDRDERAIANFAFNAQTMLREAGIERSLREIMVGMIALPIETPSSDGKPFHATCAELAAGYVTITKARFGRVGQ
jgi:hypothetical protein